MFEKLTVSLCKTQEYGMKVQEELKVIASEILNHKLGIVKLEEKIVLARKEDDSLSIRLKKCDEQLSNYEYKKQKVDIRMKEYERKIEIQNDICDKKQAHQESLKLKIQVLQKAINDERVNDQSESIMEQMKLLDLKANKQAINIHNLHSELVSKNRSLRLLEDKVFLAKKSNGNRKNMLEMREKSLGNDDNKENQSLNIEQKQRLKQIDELEKHKRTANRQYEKKFKVVQDLLRYIAEFGENNNDITKEVNKSDELLQEVKILKLGMSGIKQGKKVKFL